MKKPVKKELKIASKEAGTYQSYELGYNRAIDKSDAYWQEKIKAEFIKKSELPSVEEIEKIVRNWELSCAIFKLIEEAKK